MIGAREGEPRPAVFRFLGLLENALLPDKAPDVNYGQLVVERGCVLLSLDVPCEGQDQRRDEPRGLAGWRYRIDRGEQVMPPFVDRAKRVLDHLIGRGIVAPGRVAATGISRGAFCAFHFAADDPRIRAVAGIAPLTELPLISEFQGYTSNPEPIPVARLADRQLLVIVRDNDTRVQTAGTLRLIEAAHRQGAAPTVEIVPGAGHGIPGRDQMVADWLLDRLTV